MRVEVKLPPEVLDKLCEALPAKHRWSDEKLNVSSLLFRDLMSGDLIVLRDE